MLVATALVTGSIAYAAQPVSGKVYETSVGDIIAFRKDGKTAVELNGKAGLAYPGQAIYFGEDGTSPRTECTYKQDGAKITVTCDGVAGAIFTVNKNGSLTGPLEGMWEHTEFEHLKLNK